MSAINKFFFDNDTNVFFKRSVAIFYVASVYFIWQHDWTTYIEMSPFLFKPPGLLKFVDVSFPKGSMVLILQIFGTVASLTTIFFEKLRTVSAIVVFAILFILDFYSNGFGFINVQIHFIWFSLIFSIAFKFQHSDQIKSYLFRFLELIVVMSYFQSFLAKIVISGPSWAVDGTVLQIGILRQALPYAKIIADNNSLSQILSSMTLLFEASMILYFFLSVRFKKLLLGVAILFHVSTFISMGIGFFHLWVMNLCIILYAYKENKNEARCLKPVSI